MFSRILTKKSTETYSERISRLRQTLDEADAVVIGAGAGLSTSAGLTYSGERFQKNFGDFIQKYGIQDMYSGGFYPFETLEEHWAWWSRHIMVNRYEKAPKPVYEKLFELVKNKDYFVLTTNVDHQFQLAGFDKRGCFIRKVTMACGSAASHVVKRHMITKKSFAAWLLTRRICVYQLILSHTVRSAVSR